MSLDRPWLSSYPKNIPANINVDEFPSIVSVLKNACDKYRDHPAFSNMGKTITYAEVDRLSTQFANYLLYELKLKKGADYINRKQRY